MSLLADPLYTIHRMRAHLLTLHNDDISNRVIIFNQYTNNDYIETAELYDRVQYYCYSPNIAIKTLLNKRDLQKIAKQSGTFSSSKPNLSSTQGGNQGKTSDKNKSDSDSLNASGESLEDSMPPPLEFSRVPIVSQQHPSLLTTLLSQKGKRQNILAESYQYLNGAGEPNPIKLNIFLPFSQNSEIPMKIVVKREAIVEDVIGFILYQYIEENREPELEEELCNAMKWTLRIVEDDGTIDEDFPALERKRQIEKFSFSQFALCEATPQQVKLMEQMKKKKILENTSPFSSFMSTNTQSTNSTSTGAANIFLRIHLYSTLEIRHTTTINVSPETPLSEVLEIVSKKRKISSKDYTLTLADMKTLVPLDKTVESLQGVSELCLVKRIQGPSGGDIFMQRQEDYEVVEPASTPITEYTSIYKSYNVIRKKPMFVGKQERIFAVDGDYVRIMPPENRNVFDNVKTMSYRIEQIDSCRQHKKFLTNFRLIVNRQRDTKSYEFEAASESDAAEICARIGFLIKMNRGRTSTN